MGLDSSPLCLTPRFTSLATPTKHLDCKEMHDKHVDFTPTGSSSSPADRRVNHNSSSHGDDRHGTDRRPGNDKKLSSSKSSRKDKPDVSTRVLVCLMNKSLMNQTKPVCPGGF